VKPRWAVAIGCALLARWAAAAAPIGLPIYIEDNHAGSFYWLAEHLDPDEEFTLIHFDAHSDASAIFDSDKIRERLRRVASLEERRELLRSWRAAGTIQCFNWIEPLMPAPIARVLWVHPRNAGEEKEALAQLDGQLEAAPRAAGSLRKLYQAVGFGRLRSQLQEDRPVIVTIDLDYFADIPANRRAAEFERVWKFVAECRNLRAVTIAVSRPYLKSDEQADELLRLAVEASLSLPTANVEFEPFENVGHDDSLRAREFQKRHEEIPGFELANASETLQAVLLANRDRISVRTKSEKWTAQLATWDANAPPVQLTVRNHEPSTDNIWRLPVGEDAEIELETESAIERVEWLALVPEYLRCNLTATSSGQGVFAQGAPPRPRWREVRLPGSSRALSLGVAHRATATELGAIRVKARVQIAGHVRETSPIEIRRFAGNGFRAALTEQFGLPYLFGSGDLNDGVNTGPETGLGADCANFIVYALRRQGRSIPWSNPKQLRRYLEPMAANTRAGETRIGGRDVAQGLIVHLGSHAAAVMEDRPPLGILDRGDIVAHQLEGKPELLSLGRLLARRKTERFDLLRSPDDYSKPDLVVGGDVMLGRTIGAGIEAGADPLAGIRSRFEQAANRLVNLECVLSDKGRAAANKPYCFRAPLDAMRVLTSARINAVSLANNHAQDFGPDGLLDAMARLQANKISAIGANEKHIFTTRTNAKAAVIAFDDTNEASAFDRERAAAAMVAARGEASFVLAFVHWGEENTEKVSERQRELARWLIDHGANAVAGSHPHCLQAPDSYHGRPIFYSLGNLVFDGAPSLPNWNRGALLEVRLQAARPSFQLVPVQLDGRGFPHLLDGQDRENNFATTGAAFSRSRVQGASKNR
jgi:hypothetical protein